MAHFNWDFPETTAFIGWTFARWQCAQNQRVTAQDTGQTEKQTNLIRETADGARQKGFLSRTV
jgi:hypothetical protein